MDNVYHFVAIAGTAAVVASVLFAIVRLQGERPFSSLGALIAGVAAAGSLAVYLLSLDMALKDAWTFGLLAGGALAGAFAGSKIPLYSREGAVFCKAGGWHLAPPGLAVAAFQVAGLRGSPDGVILSLGALHAATAFTIAVSVLLLLRRVGRGSAAPAVVEPPPATAEPPVEASPCPACGVPLRAGARFCISCGSAVEASGG